MRFKELVGLPCLLLISIRASVRDAIRTHERTRALDKRISIRASVRDAIHWRFNSRDILNNFNPRIREGCDHEAVS